MRILSDDVFIDVLQQCSREKYLSFCILMRTAQRKKMIKENFRRHRKGYGIHVNGDVVIFDESKSIIHICCLANRPHRMYDELIVDSLITDEHTILSLLQLERRVTIKDLGGFESSNEILEYIGGGANAGDIRRHS